MFEMGTINSDVFSVVMDILFWMFFTVSHAYLYLVAVKICIDYAALFYIFSTFAITWAFANRLFYAYMPAMIFAVAILVGVQMRAVYDAMQRDASAWLPHFVLIACDGILVLGHTFDEMLMIDVALNCRIAYVAAAGVLIEMATVAQDSFS